jgi:transposase
MKDIGMLERFKGVLHHDFWKPYYAFSLPPQPVQCAPSERAGAPSEGGSKWALRMARLFLWLNLIVKASGGALEPARLEKARGVYRNVLPRGSTRSGKGWPPALIGKSRRGLGGQDESAEPLGKAKVEFFSLSDPLFS